MLDKAHAQRTALVIARGTDVRVAVAVANRLAEMGAKVHLAAPHTASIADKQRSFDHIRLDPAAPDAIDRLASLMAEVDILVNAGGAVRLDKRPSPVCEEISEEEWDSWLSRGLAFPFFASVAVTAGMKRRGFGRIIHVTSLAARARPEEPAHRAAVEAGITGFARCMGAELGEFGITVNCVAPGALEADTGNEFGGISAVPVGRLGTPFDVAAVVAFLSTEQAAFINGETINVNGGYFAS